MKKLFILAFVLVYMSSYSQYVNSFGVRGGFRGLGLSYKQFLSPAAFLNIEGVGQSSEQIKGGDLLATINFRNKIHTTYFQIKELTWSYGVGIHGGYYMDPDDIKENKITFGPDLRLGAEYLFKEQWAFGLDITGYYNLMPFDKPEGIDRVYTNMFGAGLFIRYVIQ